MMEMVRRGARKGGVTIQIEGRKSEERHRSTQTVIHIHRLIRTGTEGHRWRSRGAPKKGEVEKTGEEAQK